MSLNPYQRIWPDAETVAKEAAAYLAGRIAHHLASQQRCSVALSGGSTPLLMNRALAKHALKWDRVDFFFADERAVPPEHQDSNFAGAQETLFGPLKLASSQIFRMKGEAADLEAAAAEYEKSLPERLDILTLGIGEDGHTCSLFPHHALLDEQTRKVAVVHDSPKPPLTRLTLTVPAVQAAKERFMLAVGAGKTRAVRAALGDGPETFEDVPARLALDGMWYLDMKAAAGLIRGEEDFGY